MTKREQNISRLFTTVKVILVIFPMLSIMYMGLGFSKNGLDLMGAIKSSPAMTVAFLTAMIQPFVASLLGHTQKEYVKGNSDLAIMNLLLLLLAEAMMRNILGIIGLGILFIKLVKNTNFSFKHCFTNNKKGTIAKALSGGLALLPLSALCLFAIIQIG